MNAVPIATARVVLALAAAGLMAAVATPVHAEMDLAKERATAAQHAGFAAKAKDMKATQMHLHHVINCLVGPKGKGFDSKELNPCKDQGNGAIPDTADPAQKAKLEQALAKANSGLKQKDMMAARKDATEAQTLISAK